MLDAEDAWFYYHDVAREQKDLTVVMKTAEGVCSTLGLTIGRTWESGLGPVYISFLWNSKIMMKIWKNAYGMVFIMVLVVLKRTISVEPVEILKDDNTEEVMNVDPTEVQRPENVVRKEEKLMDLGYVINEIQNKFYF